MGSKCQEVTSVLLSFVLAQSLNICIVVSQNLIFGRPLKNSGNSFQRGRKACSASVLGGDYRLPRELIGGLSALLPTGGVYLFV